MAKYFALHTTIGDPAAGWEFFSKGAPALAAAMAAGQMPAKCTKTWNPFAFGRGDYVFCLWEADSLEDILTVLDTSVVEGDSGLTNAQFHIMGHVLNNTGLNRTVRYRAYYGATTIYVATHTITANASERAVDVKVWLMAANSTTAQEANGISIMGAVNTIGGVAAAINDTYLAHHHTIAETSSSDKTLYVTVTLSTASASLTSTTHTCALQYI